MKNVGGLYIKYFNLHEHMSCRCASLQVMRFCRSRQKSAHMSQRETRPEIWKIHPSINPLYSKGFSHIKHINTISMGLLILYFKV